MKFDSIKKHAYTVLFNFVSALAIPLVCLADSLAKGAGGKGPVALVSDHRVGVLLSFVTACLDRAADLKSEGPQEDDGASFEEKSNQAWRYVVELQDRAYEAGLSVNLLEIFGRVEASTVLNDMRRMLKSEQMRYDNDVSEIASADGSAHMGIIHRLSQATARLSVLAIDLEEQMAMSARIDRRANNRDVDFPCEDTYVERTGEEIERRANEVIMEESCRQSAIKRTQEILTMPMERIRDRLQTFYEQHPERRGTLRFTEAPQVSKVAPVPLSDLGVPSAMIDPSTVNVGAARAQVAS